MIAFARKHKIALMIEFMVVAITVAVMPGGEPWGWLVVFGALPWSAAAPWVPGYIGLAIVAVGLGLNVVVATVIICRAVMWWLGTLRNDGDA